MKLQINREVPEGLNREYVSAAVQCMTVSEREACHSRTRDSRNLSRPLPAPHLTCQPPEAALTPSHKQALRFELSITS